MRTCVNLPSPAQLTHINLESNTQKLPETWPLLLANRSTQSQEEKQPGSSCKEPLPEGRVPLPPTPPPPPPPPDPVLFPAQGILNSLPRLSPLSAANKRQDWQPLHKHDKQETGGVRRLSPWGPEFTRTTAWLPDQSPTPTPASCKQLQV